MYRFPTLCFSLQQLLGQTFGNWSCFESIMLISYYWESL